MLDAQGVAAKPAGKLCVILQAQGQALGLGHGPHQAADVTEQFGQIERLPVDAELASLDLGEVEDVVDDAEQ